MRLITVVFTLLPFNSSAPLSDGQINPSKTIVIEALQLEHRLILFKRLQSLALLPMLRHPLGLVIFVCCAWLVCLHASSLPISF